MQREAEIIKKLHTFIDDEKALNSLRNSPLKTAREVILFQGHVRELITKSASRVVNNLFSVDILLTVEILTFINITLVKVCLPNGWQKLGLFAVSILGMGFLAPLEFVWFGAKMAAKKNIPNVLELNYQLYEDKFPEECREQQRIMQQNIISLFNGKKLLTKSDLKNWQNYLVYSEDEEKTSSRKMVKFLKLVHDEMPKFRKKAQNDCQWVSVILWLVSVMLSALVGWEIQVLISSPGYKPKDLFILCATVIFVSVARPKAHQVIDKIYNIKDWPILLIEKQASLLEKTYSITKNDFSAIPDTKKPQNLSTLSTAEDSGGMRRLANARRGHGGRKNTLASRPCDAVSKFFGALTLRGALTELTAISQWGYQSGILMLQSLQVRLAKIRLRQEVQAPPAKTKRQPPAQPRPQLSPVVPQDPVIELHEAVEIKASLSEEAPPSVAEALPSVASPPESNSQQQIVLELKKTQEGLPRVHEEISGLKTQPETKQPSASPIAAPAASASDAKKQTKTKTKSTTTFESRALKKQRILKELSLLELPQGNAETDQSRALKKKRLYRELSLLNLQQDNAEAEAVAKAALQTAREIGVGRLIARRHRFKTEPPGKAAAATSSPASPTSSSSSPAPF